MRQLRLMLDTNLWSILSRADAGAQLYAATARHGYEVVLPPSMLLELARSGNVAASNGDFLTMSAGHRTHLPTELELQAQSFIAALRRHRPHWLRARPNRSETDALHRFWTRDIWRSARRDWANLADTTRRGHAQELDSIVSVQRENKSFAQESGARIAEMMWTRGRDLPSAARDYFNDDDRMFDFWRVTAHLTHAALFQYLLHPSASAPANVSSYADWLRGFLDMRAIVGDTAASHAELWYVDLENASLPELWLSTEVVRFQLEWKLARSSPLDAQHAGYMHEADLFLSGDRRFVDTLARMRAVAPFDFALPVMIPVGGSGALAAIEAELVAFRTRAEARRAK